MARGKSAYNRFAGPLLKAGVSMKEVARRWKSGGKSGSSSGGSSVARRGGGSGSGALSLGGAMSLSKAAAMASVFVLLGKVGSRAVPAQLGMAATNTGDKVKDTASLVTVATVQAATGLVAAMVVSAFLDPLKGEQILTGTFLGIEESLARRFEVPYVSTLAGDEGDSLMGYTYEMSGESGRVNGRDLERLAQAGNMLGMSSYPAGRALSAYVMQ